MYRIGLNGSHLQEIVTEIWAEISEFDAPLLRYGPSVVCPSRIEVYLQGR